MHDTADPVFASLTRHEADMAFKKRVATIFEWIPPDGSVHVLDAACGRGFYLCMYRHVNTRMRLTGNEIDGEVLAIAARNVSTLSHAALVQSDVTALPYADDSFDAAVVSEVLEHVGDDVGALREVRRVTRPGGTVAITVPNANYPFWWDPINKTAERAFNRHVSRGPFAGIWANHLRLYEPDQLRSAVTEAGLVIEEERSFTHHSFPGIHNLVYGFGKPLLESGRLPASLAAAADRTRFSEAPNASRCNPVSVGIAVLNWFDRKNAMTEPPGRSTVNLALKARVPDNPERRNHSSPQLPDRKT